MADGATDTNLFSIGLSAVDAPDLWNKTVHNKIKAHYRGSPDAGSDLFLSNSFVANRSALKLHGAEKYTTELTRVSAETGREIADGYNNTVIVAGCIGPTGELMEPMETFPTLSQFRYFMSKPRVLKRVVPI